MSKGFASTYRIVLLATGMFACFGGLAARLYWLHVVDRDELLRTIAKARRQITVEPARRGDILDDRGAVLATSRSRIILGVDPAALRTEDQAKWPQLAALLGMPEAQLRTIFTTRFKPVAAVDPMTITATPAIDRTIASPAAPATPSTTPTPAGGLVFNFRPLATPAGDHLAAVGGETSPVADDGETGPADDKGQRPIRWAQLAADVSAERYTQVDKLGIKGVYGRSVYRRAYPNNELAAHVIGFVNHDQQPVAGVEAYADFYLRGQNGWSVGERDGRGRPLPQFSTREVRPVDGYNVKLSIDARVQDAAEQELAAIVQKFDPVKATIIVSRPADGFILAMANYPSFNPNEYNQVPTEEVGRLRNVAVADVYEPGSVFKIVAASGALEEGLVTPATTFNCALERVDYRGHTLKLPGEAEHFDHQESMSVADIIAHSSNRGAAQLGMKLGPERLDHYARAFGFGRTLGFPVGGEVAGIFAPHDKWYPIDITRIPMGQSIAATVLQMHQAMSVVANGGTLYRPQVVREIMSASGEVVCRYDKVAIGQVISARTAQTVALLLTRVTKDGTAPEAAITGYEVAGKTGTAQKLLWETDARGNRHLAYSHEHHVGSFVGFFPASQPQVAISVIVDDADGRLKGGWGAKVAAPSFKRLGEQLVPILDIKPPVQPVRASFAMEGGRR
jgi:cell division protein FtsI (penicillin-binding protein 3)